MCTAQRCPVCNGEGIVGSEPSVGYTSIQFITCHGCGGHGWVTVHCIQEVPAYITINGEEVEFPEGESVVYAPDTIGGRED